MISRKSAPQVASPVTKQRVPRPSLGPQPRHQKPQRTFSNAYFLRGCVVYSVSEPHTQPQRGTVYINKKCVYCIFYSAMCIPATSISQVIDVAVEINTHTSRESRVSTHSFNRVILIVCAHGCIYRILC